MKTRMTGTERRDAIVAASIRLFAEHGFRGTTTRQLAREVGVTEPVLYQHFRDKRDLYRAIIESKASEGHERFERRMRRFLDRDDDEGFFTALADLILSRFEEDPDYVRLLLHSALEGHDLAKLFLDSEVHCLYEMVAAYLTRRASQGALRAPNPYLTARMFFGMVNHHGLVRVLFEDHIVRAGRKTVIREIVNTFLRGVTSSQEQVQA